MRDPAQGFVYNCTPDSYQRNPYNCEVGDISGKLGPARVNLQYVAG
jgi:hypothetical protein